MQSRTKQSLSVLIAGFAIRIVAAVVTTLTNANPDSTVDAVRFGQTAEQIAHGLLAGHPYLFTASGPDSIIQLISPFHPVSIYYLWGLMLSPFWLLPGPSGFYARLVNGFLGAFAIYNVYLIARYHHSHQAGIIATLPMIVYPSFVAIHSTLLREALVLFGITTAARLLMVSPSDRSKLTYPIISGCVLYVALILRPDNVIIFLVAIAIGLIVYGVQAKYFSSVVVGTGIVGVIVSYPFYKPLVQAGVKALARIRSLRTQGRAAYLTDVFPETIFEFVAFSWIGAAYFLYAPFPWMVATLPDLLVSIEGIISIGFTVAAIWGLRSLHRKNSPGTIGLIAGFVVAVVLYGIGTGNYGTGMRHRQMFLWVIFMLGGIGICEYVKLRLSV